MVFWRPRGCVLWYDFAELQGNVVYNLSGNGNHGTIHGAKWVRGPLIGALEFDGVDDYVDAGDFSGVPPTSDFSIELLFYPKSSTQSQVIMGQYGSDSLWIRVNVNSKLTAIYLGGASNPGYHSSATEFRPYRWWYVVFRVSGTILSIYVDARRETDIDIGAGRVFANGHPLWIGWTPYDGAHPHYGGLIAFVRIYRRALTEEEIREHYRYLFGRIQRMKRRFA